MVFFTALAALSAEPFAAALTTTCSGTPLRARLNELKAQGGGSGAKFVEVLIMGTNVSVQNWEIGYGDQNSSDYLSLGAGNCYINGSASDTDTPASRTYSYPTFITCAVSPMNANWGELVLKDNTTRTGTVPGVLDYLQYSKAATCPTPTYWAVPTGGCAPSSCVAPFSASSTDLARGPDGSGGWVIDIAGYPTSGTSNIGGQPSGQQMLKNFTFSPSSGNFCADTSNTVSVQARDMTDAIKTNYLGTVNLVWTVTGGTCSSPSPLPATLNYAAGNAGQQPLSLNCPSGTTVSLAAADSLIAGTVSTSGSYVFAGCAPSSFEIVQVNAASNNSPLFTQRTNTPFTLELRALDSNRNILTSYTGTVSIGLVNAATYPTTNPCTSLPALGSSVNYVFSAADLGKKTISFNHPNPARNVRVRATDSTYAVTSCSGDNFAIRPDYLTVSPATSIDAPASDKLAAGNDFTLTATPVYHNGGSPTALTSGYDGTPSIVVASVKDHNNVAIAASALSPTSFSAASGGAITSTFKYHDVGTIAFDANAVLDSLFTQVDQVIGTQTVNAITIDHGTAGDCVNSGTLDERVAYGPVGGLIGCTIGSASTAAFGRFVVDHYEVTTRLGPGCTAGNFTYMDNDALQIGVEVKAMSSSSLTPLSRLTSGYAYLPSTFTVSGDNGGVAVPLTRLTLPGFPAVAWTNGSFSNITSGVSETYAFAARTASPVVTPPSADVGPYESFKVKVNLVDLDAAPLSGKKITLHTNDGSVVPTVTSSSPADTVYSSGSRLRYGRLRLANAFGSERLPLSIPMTLEYFNTSGVWATNTEDSCTQLLTTASGNPSSLAYSPLPNAGNSAASACYGICTSATVANTVGQATDYAGTVLIGNPIGSMVANVSTPSYPAKSPDNTTFAAGLLSLTMGAPLSGAAYLSGAFDLTLVSPPWLTYNSANPVARVSFGIYNQLGNAKKIIYRREVR